MKNTPLLKHFIALFIFSFFLQSCYESETKWRIWENASSLIYKDLIIGVNGIIQVNDINTGEIIWTKNDDYYANNIIVRNDTLFCGKLDGLVAINIYNGQTFWQIKTNKIHEKPLLIGNLVIISLLNELVAIDLNSLRKKWRFKVDDNYDIGSSMLDGYNIFITTTGGDDHRKNYIYCLNSLTGELIWKSEKLGPSFNSMAIDENILIVPSSKNSLYAYDKKSGDNLWKFNYGKSTCRHKSSPLLYQNRIFYTTSKDDLVLINKQNGEEIWRIKLGGGGCNEPSTPQISDSIIVVGSGENNILAFNLRTKEQVWSYKVPHLTNPEYITSYSSPIINNGIVFFHSTGRSRLKLFAINLHNGKLLEKFENTW